MQFDSENLRDSRRPIIAANSPMLKERNPIKTVYQQKKVLAFCRILNFLLEEKAFGCI